MPSSQTGQGAPLEALTVAEVAALWHVNARTVRREVERGHLRAVRVGRAVRITSDAIHEYMEKGQDNA